MKSISYKAHTRTRKYADQNKQSMNLSEVRMWLMLKWSPYNFRRQKTLGNYISDFASLKHKIVIEVDGITHEEKKIYDESREQWITQHGYKILKFVWSIPFPDDLIYEYVWTKIAELETWSASIMIAMVDE